MVLTEQTANSQTTKVYVDGAGVKSDNVSAGAGKVTYASATVTATWHGSDPADYTLYNGSSFTVSITPKGNVKIMNTAHDADVASLTITVQVTDGKLVLSGDNFTAATSTAASATGTFNFRVATNNPTGAEYKVSGANTAPKGQVPAEYSTSAASYEEGAVVLQGGFCYQCIAEGGLSEASEGAGVGTFNADDWKRIDHGFDGFNIA